LPIRISYEIIKEETDIEGECIELLSW
jgi:hypothetical protein